MRRPGIASIWSRRLISSRQAVKIFECIDDLDPESLGAGGIEDQHCLVPYLMFTPEAQDRWDTWRSELEKRVRSCALDHAPAFRAHVGKQRSLVPSLALLFHLIEWAAQGGSGPIPLAALDRGIEWCTFVEAHARKLYRVELEPGMEAGRGLLDRFKRGAVEHGATVRDIYQRHWAGLNTAAKVAAALDVLIAYGWARVDTVETDGRPSDRVALHPLLRGLTDG